MYSIQIILGSTRPNRQGEKVAKAVYEYVSKQPDLEVELVDLKEWELPFFEELGPLGMLENNFSSDIVHKWHAKVSKADAYIIVTPEYNHGYPAVLKNALDYAYTEWNYKPVAFVGYSGGPVMAARAIEQLRQVVVELKMVAIRDAAMIPFVWKAFNEDGTIVDDGFFKSVDALMKELLWWTKATKTAREETV